MAGRAHDHISGGAVPRALHRRVARSGRPLRSGRPRRDPRRVPAPGRVGLGPLDHPRARDPTGRVLAGRRLLSSSSDGGPVRVLPGTGPRVRDGRVRDPRRGSVAHRRGSGGACCHGGSRRLPRRAGRDRSSLGPNRCRPAPLRGRRPDRELDSGPPRVRRPRGLGPDRSASSTELRRSGSHPCSPESMGRRVRRSV